MTINNPQSADRSYKFMYKRLGIRFHRYFYHEGENIEFIETEIPESGKRKDMVVIVDDKTIKITEFMSKPLYDDKLHDISVYHDSTRHDIRYEGYDIQTGVISIANPNHGKNKVQIDKNLLFCIDPIFTKNENGWKVLSTLVYKTIIYEELTDKEAIDLLILPDMDIDLPIKTLMKVILFLIGHANIPDADFKKDIILCEIKILERFFNDEDLSEMIEMLQTQTKNPEVARVLEKYGPGFDTIYFDGKADGIAEGLINGRAEGFIDGRAEGVSDTRIVIAKNLLAEGCDEGFISRSTGLSIDEIKKLKRKL